MFRDGSVSDFGKKSASASVSVFSSGIGFGSASVFFSVSKPTSDRFFSASGTRWKKPVKIGFFTVFFYRFYRFFSPFFTGGVPLYHSNRFFGFFSGTRSIPTSVVREIGYLPTVDLVGEGGLFVLYKTRML